MQFSAYCVECLIKRQTKLVQKQHASDETKLAYMKEVMQVMLDAPKGVAAPYVISKCNEVFARYFHSKDRYDEIKKASNAYVKAKLPQVYRVVEAAQDPVLMALRFARVGNYIDFGALGDNVENTVLDALLEKAPQEQIDPVEYAHFLSDLDKAQELLYITDNAGEIVLDRVLIEQLKKRFPQLSVCVCTRGAPVLNDALIADAVDAGMEEVAEIIDNGTSISGTQVSVVGEDLRRELARADVILCKGQGNFETMWGCGLNVYYAFLCKCEWFTKIFRVPQLFGMFVNENRVKTYPIE